jgi:hypothetical protein
MDLLAQNKKQANVSGICDLEASTHQVLSTPSPPTPLETWYDTIANEQDHLSLSGVTYALKPSNCEPLSSFYKAKNMATSTL